MKRYWLLPILLVMCGPITLLGQSAFVPIADMDSTRADHTSTRLSNGKVLIAGGDNQSVFLSSAELYDISFPGSLALTDSLKVQRARHTATLLANGRILIAGGMNASGNLSDVELFDPSTETFALTSTMKVARSSHTATFLPNGKVLLTGGFGAAGVLADAELYDPSTGQFSLTGSMNVPRMFHTATLLPNGKVLIAGGFRVANGSGLTESTAEIYDPTTGQFVASSSKMSSARELHTATSLANGNVLLAGGVELVSGFFDYKITTDIYDPFKDSFIAANSMKISRASHTATILQDGRILLAGGNTGCSALGCTVTTETAEIYDPEAGTFSFTGSMETPRSSHATTALTNGNVLVSGGSNQNGFLMSAEVYLGPQASASGWQKLIGPWQSDCDRSIGAIAVHPQSPDVIYVGNSDLEDGCGFFKSTDGGQTWSEINDGFPTIGISPHYAPITKIVMAPSNPNVLYAGTFVDTGFGFFGQVYRSQNGGKKWTNASGKLSLIFRQPQIGKPVLDLAVDPQNSAVVLVGLMGDGIFRTTNGGNFWTKVQSGTAAIGATDYFTVVRVAPSDSSTVYGVGFTNFSGPSIFCAFLADLFAGVAGNNRRCINLEGILPLVPVVSQDGGTTWTGLDLPEAGALVSDLVIDPSDKNIVYAATVGYRTPLFFSEDNKGVFVSTDGGTNWRAINDPNGLNLAQFPILKLRLEPKLSNSLYAVAGYSGVFHSNNAGTTWNHIDTTGLPDSVLVGDVAFGNQRIYILTSNGIYTRVR